MKKVVVFFTLFAPAMICFGQPAHETLKIMWPEEYKWKVGSNQDNSKTQLVEMVPGKETIDKWTIMGTMVTIRGLKNVSMDAAMNATFSQAQQNAIDPVLTLVERNDTAKNAWIIFKIEAAKFKNDNTPESQLFYVIQGESALYSNFVAIKQKTLSKEFVDKWAKIFESSQLVDQ